MATVKVKFRPSTVADSPGTIVYFVTHRRVIRQITTEYKVFPHEWNNELSMPIAVSNNERTFVVMSFIKKIRLDIKRLDNIISGLENGKQDFAADDIIECFYDKRNKTSFFNFMEEVILRLKRLGKERTAENYITALNSLKRFSGGNVILLDEIDSDLMSEYEAWLQSHGVTMNTVSFYNRILRAVYNRAVEKELTVQRYPFKYVYTGVDKTVKRAILLKDIKRIKDLDLSLKPSLDFARDIFMFSFYTRGMSFVDMAYLRKKDLKNGILSYRRRKTDRQLVIKWESYMQDIIDKYPENKTGYLLPIIKTDKNERLQYKNALRLVNNKLKDISVLAGLQGGLTMYVARHSWASIAKNQNIPLSVISAGMGHDSEITTQIYLTFLDNSVIDKANDLILRKLR